MGNEEEILGDFVVLAACRRRGLTIMAEVVSCNTGSNLKTKQFPPSNTSLKGLAPVNLHLAFSV